MAGFTRQDVTDSKPLDARAAPGTRFTHARFLAKDRTPEVFRITRITGTSVYYRAESDGGLCTMPPDRFWSVVGQWLDSTV